MCRRSLRDSGLLAMEMLQLIDISSEDDFLIASHLDDNLQDFRVSGLLENIDENEDLKFIRTMNSQEAENAANMPKQMEQQLLVSESMEPGRVSDVRKSLAWDSAFFTGAGVLDPEELCFMNQGFEKSEAHLVHKTRQDQQRKRRSVDIEYALDSDEFCFETDQSIEGDLFEDVRASIQRSSIMSNVFKSGCESGVGQARKQKVLSLKKPGDVSQKRVKSTPISTRENIYMQGSDRTKDVFAHQQIEEHAARKGECSFFFRKPPKILHIMNPVSAGQTTILLGADPINMEKKTATSRSRQGLVVSKRSGYGTLCCSTSSMISRKGSSSVSVIASNDSRASCSSSFKVSSNSRKNTDSRKIRLSATGSTFKTPPLRCSLRGKSVLGYRGLSNHHSYASAVSSIDGWSSETSSTSSKHRSNCLEANFYTNKFGGACLPNVASQQLDLHHHSHELFGHQESQQRKLLNQHIDDVAGTGNASAELRKNSRPSGLRMPSRKMGFFDEEKSPVVSVSRGLQLHFGAQSVSSDTNGTTNGEILGKTQPASVLAEKGNIKSCSMQTGVIMARYAAQSREQEESSPKVSSISVTMRNSPGKASKVQIHRPPQFRRENCSKYSEVSDGGHGTSKIGLKDGRKRIDQILKNEMRRDSKRRVRLRGSTIHPSKDEHLDRKGEINQSKTENEKEKENLSSLEDQVNSLSRYFEAIDISRDTVIELSWKKKKGRCDPIVGQFTGMEKRAVEFIPNSRTPLADKNFVCTGAESFGLR